MRKLLNKLLVKFGLLITKAPKLLSEKSLETSDAFPAELTEKVTVHEATETPEYALFDIFCADTNVHKWHHYFDVYTKHFGPVDIILDDGSHKTHHQSISFGALFRPALKDGGCYMVEDVHTNYWLKTVDSEDTFIDVSKHMIDMLHEPYFDRKETSFRHEHPEAVKALALGYLAANLASIAFYDSIVVFDKRKRYLPKAELH